MSWKRRTSFGDEQSHGGFTVIASRSSTYLPETILEGNANYAIGDFGRLRFQFFVEGLSAIGQEREHKSLSELPVCVSRNPKTVSAAV